MILSLLLSMAVQAHAQIQNEPVEIVTAPAPAVFSERAGIWPADSLPQDDFTNDRTTMSDRWNTVPGVQAREQGSPTLSIRGSAQSDRVLQLFDGAPLNMADGAGASTLLLPTEVMSGVSLIKGPASAFYGASAMAGAVDNRLRYFDEKTIEGSLADQSGKFGDRHVALIIPIMKNAKPVAQVSILSERDPGAFREHNSNDLARATAATDFTFSNDWNFSARIVEAHSSGESPGSLIFPFTSQIDQKGSLATAQISKSFGADSLASLRITDTRIWGDYDNGTSSSIRFAHKLKCRFQHRTRANFAS